MVAHSGTWMGERKWVLAPALTEFVSNIDEKWPGRATKSDGSIASRQHLANSPNSDHNPKAVKGFKDWVVRAVDVTHDPDRGVDCRRLFDALRVSQDHRVKYVIFDGRIFNGPGFETAGARRRGPWNPGAYDGYSKHRHHLHLSIWSAHAADTAVWEVGEHPMPHLATVPPPPPSPAAPASSFTDQMVAALVAGGGTPNSVNYAVRFFRRLAGKAGIDGSKPELVADWILEKLNELSR